MSGTRRLFAELNGLERDLGGRVGMAALNLGNEETIGYRADERFPICSTFKVLLAAAILAQVDRGRLKLTRHISFGPGDLAPNSPFCRAHADKSSASVLDLCRAAVVESDNTASNLLLSILKGPASITRLARSLGDSATRLDRWEPDLNEALPGDLRDTTTPYAMLGLLRHILLRDTLGEESRKLILSWMLACATGQDRIRSAAPRDWQVAHKTGTGCNGATADMGVVYPIDHSPVVLAIYVRECTAPIQAREAAIAAAARAALRILGLEYA